MKTTTLAVTVLLTVTGAGCTGSPTPAPNPNALPIVGTPAAPASPTSAAPAPTGGETGPALVPSAPALTVAPSFRYEARGRRDPFEVIEQAKGGSGLVVASAKLTGIVRNPSASLALIETQDGIGYILKPGDTLFDGRLVHIGVDSVVFNVTDKLGSPTNQVVLKLAGN
jgi:hypothetical protein